MLLSHIVFSYWLKYNTILDVFSILAVNVITREWCQLMNWNFISLPISKLQNFYEMIFTTYYTWRWYLLTAQYFYCSAYFLVLCHNLFQGMILFCVCFITSCRMQQMLRSVAMAVIQHCQWLVGQESHTGAFIYSLRASLVTTSDTNSEQ